MKLIYIIVITIFFSSCGKDTPEVIISDLQGYWEIESVIMPDGTKRDFGMSATIDFISVEGNKGIRKKVVPKIDGSFETSKAIENFEFKTENDSLRLYYSTPFDTWKETVLVLKDSTLKVMNRDHKIYSYKRFRSFNFN
jgi:hypothetical protein